MEIGRNIPLWVYKAAILVATLCWGLSFVVMKDAISVMPPSWLIGVRFLICALVLGLVFRKSVRVALRPDHLKPGIVVGVLMFIAYWFQTVGLAYTTPGRNAFITAIYCVLVPFFWWIIERRRPTVFNVIAAVMCVAGVGFVSLKNNDVVGVADVGTVLGLPLGDFLTLMCAVAFAAHIVYTAHVAEGRDMIALTINQFFFQGLCGIIVGALIETPPTQLVITQQFVIEMAYLVIFASCLALLLQNIALQHVPPAQASLLLSLESVFGVLFSVILYNEQLTLRLITGFLLIFVAIVVSETFPLKKDTGKPQAVDGSGSAADVAARASELVAEGAGAQAGEDEAAAGNAAGAARAQGADFPVLDDTELNK